METDKQTVENNELDSEETSVSTGALHTMPPDDVMVIYPNPEKKGPVRLGKQPYMPLVTSRILYSGPPGSGKRNAMLNLIERIVPRPSVCHLIHHDPTTEEYDILGEWGIPVIMWSPQDFPTLQNIENPFSDEEDSTESPPALSNPLVVVDEVTADILGKKGCSRFERMVNHVCTHRNTTLLCSIQSASNIPPIVRRGFNHFALWKQPDEMLNKILARRTSITPSVLNSLFTILKDPHEYIWIDLDSPIDSEWRYRLGFMEPIRVIPRKPGDDEQ